MESVAKKEKKIPFAYLLTFRTYGTWLHGDQRFSVGRGDMNRYGAPKIQPNVPLCEAMEDRQKRKSLILSVHQRELVTAAIIEVCNYREYVLHALNVRTNHSHVVVSALVHPEKIVNDFQILFNPKTTQRMDCQQSGKSLVARS